MSEEEKGTGAEEAPVFFKKLVCGRKMTTAPENYYPATYRGQPIYFCTEFCLAAFQADPERFYAAHSRPKTPPGI